jgi:hypothetical protein
LKYRYASYSERAKSAFDPLSPPTVRLAISVFSSALLLVVSAVNALRG